MEKYDILVLPEHSFNHDFQEHVPMVVIKFPPVKYEDYPNQIWAERDELLKTIQRLFAKEN